MADFVSEHLIEDEAALREMFPPTHDLALKKSLDHLDAHARHFVERSPFLCLSSQSADGAGDVSPRGDPPGFVKVLDERTLLIPDRPGNNRLDTLSNIISQPSVALLFLIPGYDETLRLNGRALLTRDPDLLAPLEMHGRSPRIAIAVIVEEVFLHCAKALRRSRLWQPDALQERSDMPSLMKMILDQTTGAPSDAAELEALDQQLEAEYKTSMY